MRTFGYEHSREHHKALFIAFGYGTIREAKRRMPDRPAYWLYGYSARERLRFGNPSNDRLIALAKAAGVNGSVSGGSGNTASG